ncbi:phosphohistidine phosphatase, SixA [Rippkaea orientalis PCC 8801]|uniref:Phosphohistidine phosphatase, SixA n=1 Tax=Rippkaea orientalis (strain PCC 8801 / RF-1) TaxID=41431 RepID=B7K4H1_RIPO1|nr:phosphohistidine phosphatase SixA [Rippkaea orientalis]ACK65436.1 phosphohistidine phosphatase, SixA [Rippkaea orientalis PCC 8801]
MTQLYLIRHGIAAERGEYTNDAERPLIEKGREKTTKVAQRLKEMGIQFEIILTSPLVRAYQTAEILQKVGLTEKVERFNPLSPDGDLLDWVKWWSNSGYNKENSCLALVGHQPDLGNWAEMLLWGRSEEKLIVKKAGIIGLSLPQQETPVGNSELFLLSSPKWLS